MTPHLISYLPSLHSEFVTKVSFPLFNPHCGISVSWDGFVNLLTIPPPIPISSLPSTNQNPINSSNNQTNPQTMIDTNPITTNQQMK